jgi:hypothetical protein
MDGIDDDYLIDRAFIGAKPRRPLGAVKRLHQAFLPLDSKPEDVPNAPCAQCGKPYKDWGIMEECPGRGEVR